MAYRLTQHGVENWGLGQEGEEEAGDENSSTCRMVFPEKAGPISCPVKGCSGRASTWTAIRVHFWHRHVRDTVVILEEGNLPHPR